MISILPSLVKSVYLLILQKEVTSENYKLSVTTLCQLKLEIRYARNDHSKKDESDIAELDRYDGLLVSFLMSFSQF